jgi:leucyl aminopeptidase
MIFKVVSGGLGSGKEPLLFGLPEGGKLPAWAAGWPAAVRSSAQDLLKNKQFSGKLNETFLVPVSGRWVVFVGVGKADELSLEKVRQASGTGARRMVAAGFDRFTRGLLPVPGASVKQVAQAAAEGTLLGTYSFTQWKSVKPDGKKELKAVTVVVGNGKDLSAARKGIEAGRQIAEAALWTRDMVNQPSNKLTPTILANEAKSASRKFRFSCRVFDPKQQKKLGMEALLGVARGSREPSRFIVLEYKGPGSAGKKPLVWLGKGITFDSGGISIKPSERMELMKYDMAGAAAVLGAVRAVAALKLPVHVVGLIASTENLPGGNAQKPGDVVRAMGGKTIEVINTDAEGRLVLADALGYARKNYKPAAMVDLATLTGACVVALGQHCGGLMGTSAGWNKQVEEAGQRSGERVWELPLWTEYTEAVRSDVADVKNVGDGKAGTITAAAFLREFAGEEIPWVHLDIAGVAWADADCGHLRKGATAFGVRLLVDLANGWNGKI